MLLADELPGVGRRKRHFADGGAALPAKPVVTPGDSLPGQSGAEFGIIPTYAWRQRPCQGVSTFVNHSAIEHRIEFVRHRFLAKLGTTNRVVCTVEQVFLGNDVAFSAQAEKLELGLPTK